MLYLFDISSRLGDEIILFLMRRFFFILCHKKIHRIFYSEFYSLDLIRMLPKVEYMKLNEYMDGLSLSTTQPSDLTHFIVHGAPTAVFSFTQFIRTN